MMFRKKHPKLYAKLLVSVLQHFYFSLFLLFNKAKIFFIFGSEVTTVPVDSHHSLYGSCILVIYVYFVGFFFFSKSVRSTGLM